MTRACIYARYSTDRQTESSVEDQIRLCRKRADAQGWDVVATHSDSAISGTTHVDDRPGGSAMLNAAWAGEFDILVMEGLDRLSRDQVEQERVVRRLEYQGLRIVDDVTWRKARARMDAGRANHPRGGRLPRTLFGGLLVCPHCGGAVVAVNARSYGCAARKDRGPTVCDGILIRRDLVDGRLVSEIRDKFLSPASAAKFDAMFRRAIALRTANRAEERQQAQAMVDKLSQDIARVVDVLLAVGASDALTAKLRRLEGAKEEAEAVLAGIPDDDVEIQPPPVAAIFRRALLQLAENLETDVELSRRALGRILGPIYLKQKGDQIWAEMQTGRTLLESDLYLTVVAGTRTLRYLQPIIESLPFKEVRLL